MRKTYKLTPKLWKELEGITYSWSNREVGLFGLKLPMAKGWPKLIIGKKYPVELYEELAFLRYERIKFKEDAAYLWEPKDKYDPKLFDGVIGKQYGITLSWKTTEGQWSDRPRCERCGEPVYATGGPHPELCEPCLWELQDKEEKFSHSRPNLPKEPDPF
jgi:hypothetical protein